MVTIGFQRSGGFAGITVRGRLELAEPSPAEAAALSALREMPAWRGTFGASPARDLFQYELTVTDGREGRLYRFSDDQVPDALRPLLERLSAIAEGRNS